MRHRLLLCILLIAGLVRPAYSREVPDDEEDPYFLLCGQADSAIVRGQYDEAAARLIDAMSVRPDAHENVLLLSNLGMLYSYMDRDSLALATLDEALRRAPAMKTVLANRGKVLLKLNRDEDAARDFAAVIVADSLNTEARYYHGMISLYAGRLAEAEADLDVLRIHAPDAPDTARAMATLYSVTGRDREAIPYLTTLIESDPSAEYYAALAASQLALERLSDAASTLATGMEAYPDDPELYYYRAMLNRDRYRLDDARADLRKAVALGLSPAKARELLPK